MESSETANGSIHPFLWRDGTMIDLGELDSTTDGFGTATGINDAGQVVGVSETRQGLHAFLWKGGVMSDLGTAGSPEAVAWAINNRSHTLVPAVPYEPSGILKRSFGELRKAWPAAV